MTPLLAAAVEAPQQPAFFALLAQSLPATLATGVLWQLWRGTRAPWIQ